MTRNKTPCWNGCALAHIYTQIKCDLNMCFFAARSSLSVSRWYVLVFCVCLFAIATVVSHIVDYFEIYPHTSESIRTKLSVRECELIFYFIVLVLFCRHIRVCLDSLVYNAHSKCYLRVCVYIWFWCVRVARVWMNDRETTTTTQRQQQQSPQH